jgi:hypothetical protein
VPDWKKCAVCGAVAVACLCAETPHVDDLDCLRGCCLPRPTLHVKAEFEQPLPEWPQQSRQVTVVASTSAVASIEGVSATGYAGDLDG